jgi:UDP-N-acetylglucosamine acyltransferase
MPCIHPTAIVDPLAELADDVKIAPYVVIEGRVTLGAGTIVHSHSVIKGHTVIGANCKIGPAAYVGMDPQHLGYAGESTSLYIADGAIIRETAQVHRAFRSGPEHATRLGAKCFLMAGAHVGHDAKIGDDVVLANGCMLGGYTTVGSRVFLGGGCAIHQFARIGRLAIVGGNEAVTRDVPPFAAVWLGGLKGYNAVGCKRAGLHRDTIRAIRAAFHCLHSHRTTSAAIEAIEQTVSLVDEVREILAFAALSKRGLVPSQRFLATTAAMEEV